MSPDDDIIYPSLAYSDVVSRVWNETIASRLENRLMELAQEWRSSAPTQGNLPIPEVECLYRYRSFNRDHPERIKVELTDRKLWTSSIDRFNDPLEAAFVYRETINDAENAAIAQSVIMMLTSNWYGCICFSIDPVCVQMWAHYAAEHSGFCIKYRRIDSYLLCSDMCRPVMYRRGMPLFDQRDACQSEQLHQLLWTKSEAWEYEREWRMTYPRANAYTANEMLSPTGIIFGLRTKAEDKAFLRSCGVGVRFGQIERTREPYKLKIRWEENIGQ